MLRHGRWLPILLALAGCQLVGSESGTVGIEPGPAQIVVENRTGVAICVWMIDERTAVLADIAFEPCLEPNLEAGQTKIFPVQVPEGEAGITMVVFWATFLQNDWRWQRVWVPASTTASVRRFGQ
ncbi:hypothetical protein Rhom172_2744 [Rhodothermus marinus SG0.5JP17-172]|uniref:hypothetical protein n=1 Tax=Rhodothermus marinus TaxID=29549 RepID=UPI000223DED9|nr:hypothetical protein [Rhodothermus marinus]AEN74628.1 hypothetical protein Rhom172_2744 [Rhodothermus marinus SG0.5JP17-172]